MSTVRQRRKNGSVYVYESHNVWDKDRKRPRAVRTYLGREDPETGELIPSSGRRGRRPAGGTGIIDASNTTSNTTSSSNIGTDGGGGGDLAPRVSSLESRLADALRQRDAAVSERDAALAELASARAAIASALSALGSA